MISPTLHSQAIVNKRRKMNYCNNMDWAKTHSIHHQFLKYLKYLDKKQYTSASGIPN